MPTLASCSFDKHGLILIIFGKQHQHPFKNDLHIQLSLSLHFYLLYLLLHSCNGNDAFWLRSMLVQQLSSFSKKDRILSLQIWVYQTVWLTRKPYRLQNLATDAGMCVHCTKHMYTIPATWCSTSMTHGQTCHKMSKLLVNEEIGCVHAWRQKDITLNIC